MQGGDTLSLLEAGLPNITGGLIYYYYDTGTRGAFSHTASGQGVTAGNSVKVVSATFDASRCSTIYRNDCNTVQPPALQLIPQIRY